MATDTAALQRRIEKLESHNSKLRAENDDLRLRLGTNERTENNPLGFKISAHCIEQYCERILSCSISGPKVKAKVRNAKMRQAIREIGFALGRAQKVDIPAAEEARRVLNNGFAIATYWWDAATHVLFVVGDNDTVTTCYRRPPDTIGKHGRIPH